MSAYHVSDTHINTIISWARAHHPSVHRYDLKQSEDFQQVGQLLRDANNASMEARYGDEPHDYLPKHITHAGTAGSPAIISACDCLDYQSCEYDGWEKSSAHKILFEIRDAAIRRLTGYAWHIDDENSEVTEAVA